MQKELGLDVQALFYIVGANIVKDGSYVIQRPFVLVTKTGAKLSENAQKFFDFALSAEAAQYITSAGAVPVNG